MGNSQTIYVIGEVDIRAVRLDQPWLRKTNLCLRYTQFSTDRPTDLSIDYENPLNIEYFWIDEDDAKNINLGGFVLRKNNQTKLVLLKGSYNYLTKYSNLKLVESKIVPITNSYSLK